VHTRSRSSFFRLVYVHRKSFSPRKINSESFFLSSFFLLLSFRKSCAFWQSKNKTRFTYKIAKKLQKTFRQNFSDLIFEWVREKEQCHLTPEVPSRRSYYWILRFRNSKKTVAKNWNLQLKFPSVRRVIASQNYWIKCLGCRERSLTAEVLLEIIDYYDSIISDWMVRGKEFVEARKFEGSLLLEEKKGFDFSGKYFLREWCRKFEGRI
jgi:hypothetical protein